MIQIKQKALRRPALLFGMGTLLILNSECYSQEFLVILVGGSNILAAAVDFKQWSNYRRIAGMLLIASFIILLAAPVNESYFTNKYGHKFYYLIVMLFNIPWFTRKMFISAQESKTRDTIEKTKNRKGPSAYTWLKSAALYIVVVLIVIGYEAISRYISTVLPERYSQTFSVVADLLKIYGLVPFDIVLLLLFSAIVFVQYRRTKAEGSITREIVR